jgi:hypothetical protein
VNGRGRDRLIRRWAPLALALVAVPLGMAPGTNPGQNPGCRPGVSVEVPAASTPGVPQRVATSASVVCPTPEAPGGANFGPRQKQQFGPPGTPGQPCTATVLEPMELSLTGDTEMVFWPDPSNPGTGSDTPEPQSVARVISGIDAKGFFMQGGTTDFFNPFTLNGVWDGTGFQCKPKDPANPQASFRPVCTGATIALGCLVQQGHAIGGGPLGIGALQGGQIDLRARMLQLVHPGQITSLPAQPNPALVNSPACFFINGADIDGQDVNQPATFELVLLGPADATGRQVYYVFRVDLALTGVTWTFGDGSGATEPLPQPCLGVSGAPLQFAHRYLRYSPADGFPVGATETFSVHVTEYWYDSDGQPNPPLDLGDLQPIVTNPGPVPQFRKVVLQEEGVPVG